MGHKNSAKRTAPIDRIGAASRIVRYLPSTCTHRVLCERDTRNLRSGAVGLVWVVIKLKTFALDGAPKHGRPPHIATFRWDALLARLYRAVPPTCSLVPYPRVRLRDGAPRRARLRFRTGRLTWAERRSTRTLRTTDRIPPSLIPRVGPALPRPRFTRMHFSIDEAQKTLRR
jgi:hypothetical protein